MRGRLGRAGSRSSQARAPCAHEAAQLPKAQDKLPVLRVRELSAGSWDLNAAASPPQDSVNSVAKKRSYNLRGFARPSTHRSRWIAGGLAATHSSFDVAVQAKVEPIERDEEVQARDLLLQRRS